MYKIASENAQRRREHIKLAAVAAAGNPEAQTPEDRLKNLKASLVRLEALLQDAKARADTSRVKALGLEKIAVQRLVEPIAKLVKERNRLRHAGEISRFEWFYKAAKSTLSVSEMNAIRMAAYEMQLADPHIPLEGDYPGLDRYRP